MVLAFGQCPKLFESVARMSGEKLTSSMVLRLASRPPIEAIVTEILFLNNQAFPAAASPSRLCVASSALDHERVASRACLSSFARRRCKLFDIGLLGDEFAPPVINWPCVGSPAGRLASRGRVRLTLRSKTNTSREPVSLVRSVFREARKHLSQNLRLVQTRQRRRTILSPHSAKIWTVIREERQFVRSFRYY